MTLPLPGNPVEDFNIQQKFDAIAMAWVDRGAGIVAGGVQLYAGATVPAGYLLCDGTSYLRTTYPALFAAIGVTYGAVDGTHFNVPDLRDRVPVGVSGTIALAAAGGAKTVTLAIADLPSHGHALRSSSVTNGIVHDTGTGNRVRQGGANSTSSDTELTGGGGAHNNMQPYLGMNWLIKT
jgi:microcystin-dependent protein